MKRELLIGSFVTILLIAVMGIGFAEESIIVTALEEINTGEDIPVSVTVPGALTVIEAETNLMESMRR